MQAIIYFSFQPILHLFQVQSVTAVGGGSFSSPVTVSLRESSDNLASPVVIITVTSVTILLMSSLLVTSTLAYICWYVIVVWCIALC